MSEEPKRRLQLRYVGVPNLGGRLKLVDKETQQEIEGAILDLTEVNHTIGDTMTATAKITIMITREEDILIFPDEVESTLDKVQLQLSASLEGP